MMQSRLLNAVFALLAAWTFNMQAWAQQPPMSGPPAGAPDRPSIDAPSPAETLPASMPDAAPAPVAKPARAPKPMPEPAAKPALAEDGVYTIGVAEDGPSEYFSLLLDLIEKELDILVGDERKVVFKQSPEFDAKWDLAHAPKALESALNDPEVDLVLANGILVAQAAAETNRSLSKPVISGFVQDPDSLGLPVGRDGRSTKKNFNFVIIPLRSSRDIEVFYRMAPFKHLGIVMDSKLIEGLNGYDQGIETMKKTYGASATIIPANTSAADTLAGIPGGVDAIYLTPALRMSMGEWQKVLDGINAKKIPTFSMMGHMDVEGGALAGLAPECNDRLARRVALNMEQIMAGTAPEALQVPMSVDEKLVINAKTAKDIGYSPSFELLTEAVFLHEEMLERGDRIDLRQAVQLALENNIELAVRRAKVREMQQDRNRAMSYLLPQASASADYTQIDKDRAESSMGAQAEKESKLGASLTQIILNDSVISQYRASKRYYEGSLEDQESLRLDVIETAAKNYLTFLQSRALLRIDADNLNLTMNNLDLARIRQQVGTAGPEEVYRWETQAASQKATLIKTASSMDKAQVALNQTLGIDLNTKWHPTDIELGPTNFYFLDGRLNDSLQNDLHLRAFESFIEELAVRRSPQLAYLDRSIEASRIMLAQYQRRFFVPEAGASVSYDRILDQTFAGQTASAGGSSGSPEADKNEWTAGVTASLPLFQGGLRVFDVARARAQLDQLLETRRQSVELIRQQAKSVMYSMESSYPNVRLQRLSAEFAEKNYQVVKDKYGRGVVSILDLLDAQNQAVVGNQNATIAVYSYLSDVIQMQRVMSWFELEQTEQAKELWVKDFMVFLQSGYFEGRGSGLFK